MGLTIVRAASARHVLTILAAILIGQTGALLERQAGHHGKRPSRGERQGSELQ
jgi:hypothetical protein